MNQTLPYLFLLGGHDLEMLTIREWMVELGFQLIHKAEEAPLPGVPTTNCFADKNLSWGAKLSEYLEFLDFPGQIFGIELTEDISPPDHYVSIDHHNERSGEPSSIEQFARLMKLPLNRYRQLVAANDSGYIPGMKAFNATDKEIAEIRKADKKAQGVTEADERLAERSIAERLTKEGDLTIIESLGNKFSPITDRLYGQANKLLIFNSQSLTYYGQGIAHLTKKFSREIKKGQAYSGGGESGFFGLTHEALKSGAINCIHIIKSTVLP